MLTKIKKLDVDAGALIELVQDENANQLILKTCTVEEVYIEKAFVNILKKNNIPHLEIYENDSLLPNQLLLEYVLNANTLGQNETVELFEKWGQLMKNIHSVKNIEPLKIIEDGNIIKYSWSDFVDKMFEKGAKRNSENKLLSDEKIEKIKVLINELKECGEYSLIHGDMHSNNILIRDGELIPFDKGSYMLYGDRFYDLAIFMIGFGHSSDKHDVDLKNAFFRGYGEIFSKKDIRRLSLNTLLRSFERNGNKFEPKTGEIVEGFI